MKKRVPESTAATHSDRGPKTRAKRPGKSSRTSPASSELAEPGARSSKQASGQSKQASGQTTRKARTLRTPQKPTVALVARRARVSTSTVSRVLNGGYASDTVRRRVERVVEKLGYTPSPTARHLKFGRAGCIGVVVGNTQGPWFTQLLGGIEEQLVGTDFAVLLCSLTRRGEYDASAALTWIAERRVDGLVFASASARERPLVEHATKLRVPVAFVAPDCGFGVGHVFQSRNREAGRQVAEHLLALGHHHVAFIGGPKASVDTRERLYGLKQRLELSGAMLRAADTHFAPDYGPTGGSEYAESWLSLPRDEAPTAVVLGSDSLALGFMRSVQQRGIRIPLDVSVVGFDGIPEGDLAWPRLTTGSQATSSMGAAACAFILQQIDSAGLAPEHYEAFAMTLVIRESTGPAPSRTLRVVRAS